MICKKEKRNFSWLFTLLLSVVILYSRNNCVLLLLSIIPLFFLIKNRKNNLDFFLKLFCSFVPLMIISITDFSIFEWIVKNDRLQIRKSLINFVENSYDRKTSSFIKLFLLNERDEYSKIFYKQIISLSVVYLVVIGGIQTGIAKKIIFYIVKKKKIANFLFLCFGVFYCYILNFNISVLRVVVYFCVMLVSSKKYCFNSLGICGLLIASLSPTKVLSFGFPLSFVCTFIVMFVHRIEIQNKFYKKILMNFLTTLVTIPFVLAMNGSISVFFFFTSLFFGTILLFVYTWTLMTFFIKPLMMVHFFIFSIVETIINTFDNFNIVFPRFFLGPVWGIIFFYGYIFNIIFIYKKHDNNILWPRWEPSKIQNSITNKT